MRKDPARTTRRVRTDGYVVLLTPGHPRANRSGMVFEHILVVELAMGKQLRRSASVHHVNERKDDNDNRNLVACDSNGYHLFLHMRQNALDACGHAGWRQCSHCSKYDDPSLLLPHSRYGKISPLEHPACRSAYHAKAHLRRKAAAATSEGA